MQATQYAPVGSTRVAFDVTGSGHPLVLIHSGLGNRSLFDEQVTDFSLEFQIIRIDLRGYGDSVRTPEPYRSAEDVLAVVDSLDIDKFHILGVSMGAQVAIDVAVIASERVTALVAVSARCGTAASEDLKAAWEEVDRLQEEEGIPAAVEKEAKMWVDGFGRSAESVDAELRARISELNGALFERIDSDDQEMDIDPPAAERLGSIIAPTLIVWGEHDFPVYLEAGINLAEAIPAATSIEIADSAHLPNNEQPDVFNKVVLDFLTHH